MIDYALMNQCLYEGKAAEVEQMFCTSEAGGAITFADLTDPNPEFVEVSLDEVAELNSLVRRIIR